MITVEDECVGCLPSMGCLGSSCPYRSVEHKICDICENEVDTLYNFEGQQVCEDCLTTNAEYNAECAYCGCLIVNEDLYEYEGDVLCYDCLLRIAEIKN